VDQKLPPNKRKIFISWSGKSSHRAALALKESLPTIIQVLDPFLSSEDIDKGVRWFSDIGGQLAQANFGILCMTRYNLEAPWILFEAGALSKSLDHSRVVPLLIGVSNSDLKGPLSQFNTASIDKDDVKKLLKTINTHLGDHGIAESQLNKAFELSWPELEKSFTDVLTTPVEGLKTPQSRPQEEIFDEILQLTRQIAQRSAASVSPSRSVRFVRRDDPFEVVDMEIVRRVRDVLLKKFTEPPAEPVSSEELFDLVLATGISIPAYALGNALDYLREIGAIKGPRYLNADDVKQHGAMTITTVDIPFLSNVG
jgi:TIR domain-containing protein